MKIKYLAIIGLAAVLLIASSFILWNYYATRAKAAKKVKEVKVSVAKKEPVRKAVLPKVAKNFTNPKVAIVIDDFGYSMNNVDALLAMDEPLTLSILPNLRYSRKVAEAAAQKGKEVILHLPLEAKDSKASHEFDTIRSGMSDKEKMARLDSDINSIPGLKGVSNHQGSKATEDPQTMALIFKRLKEKRLYFLDSLTSEKSVAKDAASRVGIKFAKRDIFLDNKPDVDYIKKQFMVLRNYAFRNGMAIGICHDRPNTTKVLREILPELSEEGIRFVFLSEMVR